MMNENNNKKINKKVIYNEKKEKISRGTVLKDKATGGRYLVVDLDIEKKSINCLGQRFNFVSLGLDWINNFDVYEYLDIDKIIEYMKNGFDFLNGRDV